jgi:hypothetical protein
MTEEDLAALRNAVIGSVLAFGEFGARLPMFGALIFHHTGGDMNHPARPDSGI